MAAGSETRAGSVVGSGSCRSGLSSALGSLGGRFLEDIRKDFPGSALLGFARSCEICWPRGLSVFAGTPGIAFTSSGKWSPGHLESELSGMSMRLTVRPSLERMA